MELSKRLSAVAGLVTEGASVADIGTDHGYIPIYLVQSGKCPFCIAMDVNKGPLERARLHVKGHLLGDQIELRLSDGLKELKAGEVEEMIAAGMGGNLVIRILQDSPRVSDSLKCLILQPQSEIAKVRRYLNTHGFRIWQEDMVFEDGKYYPMMKAYHGLPENYEEWEYLYGKRLLEMRHPVLWEYLQREEDIKESVLLQLWKHRESESAKERIKEVEAELTLIRRALEVYQDAM